MVAVKRELALVLVAGLGGCVDAEDDAFVTDLVDEDIVEISADEKRVNADAIKAAAAARGITNALVIAGIANHESVGLSQCWADLTWACQGPWSNDCGGPVMAGSGD